MSAGLPRRDAWLLPLISVVTILLLLAGAEATTRVVWPEQAFNACRIPDPVLGHRYRANCSSETKTAEGPWVRNDYNGCGYRSAASCDAVPAGTRRIALIGSSLSEGYMVAYPDTVAARLGTDLTRMCGAPVDVQNLGAFGYYGHFLVPRMAEALRLKPDMVMLLIFPFDIDKGFDADQGLDDGAAPAGGLQRRIVAALRGSRTVLMAQHFLFQDPAVYLSLFLGYAHRADFLHPPFSPRWAQRQQVFDALIGQLASQAHDAGVPFTLAFVPQEAEILLTGGRPLPPGIDPAALPDALRALAARHGVTFIDTSAGLGAEPNPERLFYQVDGHLSGRGQPIVAADIARRVASEASGPFAACNRILSTRLQVTP